MTMEEKANSPRSVKKMMDPISRAMDDIIENDDRFKQNLLRLIQHDWPYSLIKGKEAFFDVLRKEISGELAKELSSLKVKNRGSLTQRRTF